MYHNIFHGCVIRWQWDLFTCGCRRVAPPEAPAQTALRSAGARARYAKIAITAMAGTRSVFSSESIPTVPRTVHHLYVCSVPRCHSVLYFFTRNLAIAAQISQIFISRGSGLCPAPRWGSALDAPLGLRPNVQIPQMSESTGA